jgi:Peptidase family M1 domain
MAGLFARRRGSLFTVTLVVGSVSMAQTTPPPTPDETVPHGKVLFNRDQDTPVAKATKPPAEQQVVNLTDAERASLTFSAYDLDVHLTPTQSRLEVHAGFTVKNSGKDPLARVAFQISSSLQWETIAAHQGGRISPLPFTVQTVDTDADHTGKATEAIVSLPQPLQPGGRLELTTFYSGEVKQSAERLERIGAPADQAARADWDQISPERVALRGFGNVLWYPTAAVPVFLGDGAKLFESVGQTKLQQATAMVHLRLSVEYTGDAPDAAFFCGWREQLKAVSENQNLPVAESMGVATAEFSERQLGFRTPSLFVTDRAGTLTDNSLISAVTEHYDAVPSYSAGAGKVSPLLKEWLGDGPLSVLYLLDHDGQPFEDDALLVAPMRAAAPDVLAPPLAHSLSHAWFGSSHVWLDEGVPQFMSLLWLDQTQGREAALRQMQEEAKTLALAEPAPAAGASDEGQSLIMARDEVYYRTKAAAVLWMLRSLVGDEALKRVLRSYREDKLDTDPKEFQRVLEQVAKRDLGWFFNDWVYQDRGLPDLSIASVTPRALDAVADKGPGWLVAVEVKNDGGATADVPVTVRSGTLTVTERLRIPGRSSASTRIVFAGTPQEVLVNDGSVPEVATSVHSRQIVSQ